MTLQQHEEPNDSRPNRERSRIRRSSEEISIIKRQQAAERASTYIYLFIYLLTRVM